MLKNWLITALRNFKKHKAHSAINILGLTIGLTSCLLIALYIRHELSYDRFEEKGDRIARVIMEYHFDGQGDTKRGNFTSTKVAPAFQKNFPEVVSAVRMTDADLVVGYGDKLFSETRFMYADSSFFNLFSMSLLKGDVRSALSGPRKVIVTESTAGRYFGKGDPLGKMLRVGTDSTLYEVTGVMKDVPSHSQFRFDFLASFSSLGANQEQTYWDANYTTYLLLTSEGARATLQAKIPAFMKKEMKGEGATVNFYLEPFLQVHLHSPYDGFEPNTSITYIYILAGIALLILVIACATYINLSTARSIERAREVGVRKVIGAGRGQLFWQFIGESALVCMTSAILSLSIAWLLLPAFNGLTGKELIPADLLGAPFLIFVGAVTVLVSLVAGSYPALILAGFQPIKVLKGSFRSSRSGQGLRQSLTVFQLVISVFLIVSTFIMQEQLSYIQHKKLGYDRDHILVLPMNNKMQPQLALIKQELRSDPDVLSVSRCVSTPVSIHGGYIMRSSTMPAGEQLSVTANPIDEDYLRTTGLQLVAGENLTLQDAKDAAPPETPVGSGNAGSAGAGAATVKAKPVFHFILNESAARALGWSPREAIGKRMFLGGDRPGFVKGVVKDFHFESLHHAIRPLVLFPEGWGRQLLVKMSGQHLTRTIAGLEAKWKVLVPYMPFEYRFLDEDYNKLYSAERRLGRVMNIFSLIAIVLAGLGLFGLSSYAARQRVKEIGIRKVLGASMMDLIVLLSGSFIRLTALALLIAIPLAAWLMNRWLQDFEYRVSPGIWIFAGTSLLVLLITLVTVSLEAMRTAMINPVKNLKE
ncbi:MAG TPA: ABC transporter permease [Puia sp.]|nr:ABC transporter permease [Puia sp.]